MSRKWLRFIAVCLVFMLSITTVYAEESTEESVPETQIDDSQQEESGSMEESVAEESSRPEESVPEESSKLEESVPEESSKLEESVPEESSEQNESMGEEENSRLPEESSIEENASDSLPVTDPGEEESMEDVQSIDSTYAGLMQIDSVWYKL